MNKRQKELLWHHLQWENNIKYRERVINYNKKYREINKEKFDLYYKNDYWKKYRNNQAKLYRQNNPLKYRARYMVFNYLKSGKLIKLPCEKCGELKSQAHHEDYTKPLKVVWLCKKHHTELHNKFIV